MAKAAYEMAELPYLIKMCFPLMQYRCLAAQACTLIEATRGWLGIEVPFLDE